MADSRTNRSLAKRGVLERNAPEVAAMLLSGETHASIAAIFKVTPPAVTQFAERHAEDIAAMRQEVARQVAEYAISQQVNRIADAQLRRDLLDEVRRSRANGGTGMETGIVARQLKVIGAGKNQQVVEEFKVDTAFLAEWRANDAYVADTLGQTPRPDSNTTVNVGILVRQLAGYNPEDIG